MYPIKPRAPFRVGKSDNSFLRQVQRKRVIQDYRLQIGLTVQLLRVKVWFGEGSAQTCVDLFQAHPCRSKHIEHPVGSQFIWKFAAEVDSPAFHLGVPIPVQSCSVIPSERLELVVRDRISMNQAVPPAAKMIQCPAEFARHNVIHILVQKVSKPFEKRRVGRALSVWPSKVREQVHVGREVVFGDFVTPRDE